MVDRFAKDFKRNVELHLKVREDSPSQRTEICKTASNTRTESTKISLNICKKVNFGHMPWHLTYKELHAILAGFSLFYFNSLFLYSFFFIVSTSPFCVVSFCRKGRMALPFFSQCFTPLSFLPLSLKLTSLCLFFLLSFLSFSAPLFSSSEFVFHYFFYFFPSELFSELFLLCMSFFPSSRTASPLIKKIFI